MLSSQILLYIEAHETAWSLTTWKSEKSRLNKIANVIDKGPEALHKHLVDQGSKPYTIKTTFIRVCGLEVWLGSGNNYQSYMKKHANRFKHAYQKEELEITFEEAVERIQRMDEQYRPLADALLRSGLRISEVDRVDGDRVVGKGGKSRKVFSPINSSSGSKSNFRAALREIGLKPHTLRKLLATRLAEKGATAADLCKVFGWTSITTSYQYLQAKDDTRLETFISESTK